jgi:hypothetical protein
MNSKVKKEMYTPMPRHRSSHEASKEIKSCLTTPSGGFAKTPPKFLVYLLQRRILFLQMGRIFHLFGKQL